jgi:hypothetical protein
VRVEVDCGKDPGAILKSIAAGNYSLSSSGKKLDPQRLVGAPSFATFVFDLAVAINRKLNKLPFRIPRSLKRAVKKCV